VRPTQVKTAGYLVSTASVALLGVAAWPGAAKAGLTAVLVLGMIASVAGMACRWWSYELEHRRESEERRARANVRRLELAVGAGAPATDHSESDGSGGSFVGDRAS
jgi:hypothetical protein